MGCTEEAGPRFYTSASAQSPRRSRTRRTARSSVPLRPTARVPRESRKARAADSGARNQTANAPDQKLPRDTRRRDRVNTGNGPATTTELSFEHCPADSCELSFWQSRTRDARRFFPTATHPILSTETGSRNEKATLRRCCTSPARSCRRVFVCSNRR
jgi:hypothetical protein